jgi:ABC-type nitrate/sulfonate/bicarbonate transport system substrate-binding protein
VIAAQQRVSDFFYELRVVSKPQVVADFFDDRFNQAVFAS